MCVKTMTSDNGDRQHRGRRRHRGAPCATTAVTGRNSGRRRCWNQLPFLLQPTGEGSGTSAAVAVRRCWNPDKCCTTSTSAGRSSEICSCWNHDLFLLEPAQIFATSIFRFCLKPTNFFATTFFICWNRCINLLPPFLNFAGTNQIFCFHVFLLEPFVSLLVQPFWFVLLPVF